MVIYITIDSLISMISVLGMTELGEQLSSESRDSVISGPAGPSAIRQPRVVPKGDQAVLHILTLSPFPLSAVLGA